MSGVPAYSYKALIKLKSTLKKVDFIVYTESQNNPNVLVQCNDVEFWKAIFENFYPSKKIEYRPLGSKTQLNHMLTLFEKNGKINGIYFTMDRDYDRLFSKAADLKKYNIVTTYGYSWENDLFSVPNVEVEIFNGLGISSATEIKKLFKSAYDELNKKLRRATFMDYVFISRGSSLFTRGSSFGGIISTSGGNKAPKIDTSRILTFYKNNKRACNNASVRNFSRNVSPVRDCYGKIVLSYMYHYFVFAYKKFTGHVCGINTDAFPRMVIGAFGRTLSRHPKSRIFNHYKFLLDA